MLSVSLNKTFPSLQIERLQSLLQDSDPNKRNFADFEQLPLPLDPSVMVRGILPEKATLFKVILFFSYAA